MTDNTKTGYYDEHLTFDGIQKSIDKLATEYPSHMGVITTIGKHGSLLSILHDDIKEQNRLVTIQTKATESQNKRLEILSWVVGGFTLISTVATILSLCK